MARKTIPGSRNKSQKLLVKSKSGLKISKSLIISESNVKKTKSKATNHEKFTSKKASKDDLCSKCGIREKGPGFRFLCRYCFRNAGDESVYSVNPSTMSKDIFFVKIPK